MLINCVAYQEGKKLCDIPVEAISDFLVKPGCFVWVALRDAIDEEMAQMKEEFNLHELAVEDAARGHQRPKIEEYGDCLFTVVHTVDQVLTMMLLVSAGLGIAFVPDSVRRLGIDGVRLLPLATEATDPVELHLLWARDSRNPALRRVLETLQDD